MLVFELAISLIFFVLSIAVAVMAKLLPVGLAPVFWVSAGAFPFILSVILALLSIWWAIDTLARIRQEKKLNSERKPWLDELLGDKTQKIHFVVICAAVLIYVFVIASFIFLCVTIKFFNEISFPKTLLISASAVIIIYVVFHFGLKVIMPK